MNEKEKKRALDAVLVEYDDLRDEIKRRIDQRTHMTQLTITIDGTLAGVAFYTGNFFILGIIPFVTAFCLLNIKASYATHMRLIRYIREIIEGQKLPSIFEGSDKLWVSWETFFKEILAHPQRQKASRRPIYDMFQAFVSIICSGAVALYSFMQFDFEIAMVISVGYAVMVITAVHETKMIDPYEVDKDVKYDWHKLKPL